MSRPTTTAIVLKMVAKPETRDEVAAFLTGALDLANAEPGTTVWFALLAGPPELLPADVLAAKVP